MPVSGVTNMAGLSRESLEAAITAEERERREESATRRLLKQAQSHAAELEKMVDLLTAIDGVTVERPDWAQPPKARKERRAIANLMLSDLHLDEVVRPEQLRHRNAYNRDIALGRLTRTGTKTIEMARDYISGVTYDGLYLWCNGDLLSGGIHDELRRTNAGDVIESVDYWVDHLAALIDQLASFFGRVHVVCSYGNHGRSTMKPEAKNAVRSSFDWLTMRIVHRELRSDERLTWNIPESLDVREEVYSTRILMQHGDDFKGRDQVAGAVRPVMMGDYRTLVVEVVDGEPYDLLLVGHFHQYHALPRAIINGSLVGFSEFSARHKFRPEPPKQAFWLTTPEHGPTMHLPILPLDRAAEGW